MAVCAALGLTGTTDLPTGNPMETVLPAGWYADPADSSRYRYWAGDRWTTHVRDRGAVDIAGARPLPDFDSADVESAEPSTGRRRRRVPVLLAVLFLVALAAAAGVVTLGGSDSSQAAGNTLTGEVRVAIARTRGAGADSTPADGTRCGTGAPPGVGAGTEVTVSNARGDDLGRTVLRAGQVDRTRNATTCVFDYAIAAVANARIYAVQVSGRPASRMTTAQLESAGWRVDLSVG